MNNLWLKIRVWTKISIFSAVAVYAILFAFNNYGKELNIWLFFGQSNTIHTYALRMLFSVFVFGIVSTLLFGTVRRTIRQVSEIHGMNRAEQEQKAKIESAVAAAVAPNAPTAISDTPPHIPPNQHKE